MSEPVSAAVVLPKDADVLVRRRLGLAPGAPLRIAFVAGPGDVVGTFEFWQRGEHDARTPVIAYSSMFYSIVAALGAEALVLEEHDRQPSVPDPRFTFVHAPHRRGRGGIGFRLDERDFVKTVLGHVRPFNPHIVLIGAESPAALITGLPGGVLKVVTAHNALWAMGQPPSGALSKLKMWLRTRGLRRADAAIGTSEECALQIAAVGGPSGKHSYFEIPQILPAFFPPAPGPKSPARRLMYLGRIEASKGVFDLLSAFAAVAADHPDLTLDFVGSGAASPALSEEIARLSCADRVIAHGVLDARRVHDKLDQTDLLICPSRTSEGLALVVVEASVHGVPSLLSSLVPAKTLLPGACVEFPAQDVAAMT
ncbi:MAG TPA: glycosyltransferase family 4 protein, partial [Tabrizicola sp.]|nr:glycosyltransferase family 4 protein [Tabrizicola sp.]